MTTTSTTTHRMTWFVYAGREKIRHTRTMQGQWAYDAECSCGWASATGAGRKSYIDQIVWEHKNGFGA